MQIHAKREYNIQMKTTIVSLMISAFMLVVSPALEAQSLELKLPAVLGDNAVIQRDIPVPIWGWGRPNSGLTVSLGGRTVYAKVGDDGAWKLSIGPFPAGDLGDLVVIQGKKTIISKNLAAGEVWFCSGQSNMAMSVSSSTGWEKEKFNCSDKSLRLLKITGDVSPSYVSDAKASWKTAEEPSVDSFSAVGYYFGKALRKELSVPVGIIMSAWNGTTIEVWMPKKELGSKKEFKPILNRWKKRVLKEPRIAVKESPIKLEISNVALIPIDGSKPIPMDVAGSATAPVWNEPWKADNSSITFKVVGDKMLVSGKLGICGWVSVSRPLGSYENPIDYSKYNAIKVRVRGKGIFNIQVWATDVWDWAWHTSKPFKVTSEWKEVTLKFTDFTQADWGWSKPLNAALVYGFAITADTGMNTPEMPSGLFNAMVAPVIPHGIRGVLWYQGETNSDRAVQYRQLLPALIGGWRREWGIKNLPFYVVQLANYGKENEGVEENDWSEMREAQALALTLSNTGLATAVDIGDGSNIHPKNKVELGRRLSLVALANVYGKSIEYSGPMYKSSGINSGKVSITFSHANGMKPNAGTLLKGFSLAGKDRVFHIAKAEIMGERVIVQSDNVPEPVSVRYSWAKNPAGNLVNSSGLPALPFRSDDWKLSTAGKM